MPKTICIAGKNRIAIDGLNHLLKYHSGHRLLAICNPTDDGTDGWQPSFRRHCRQAGVAVTTLDAVYAIEDMIFISLQFSEILKTGRFRSPHLFNIHFSLLPAYKGMDTILHTLRNGERRTGATLHLIDDGIDTGATIAQRSFPIGEQHTARDLYSMHLDNAAALFREQVAGLLTLDYTAHPQGHHGASYYGRNAFDYSRIEADFRQCAWQVHNHFRALIFPEFQLPEFNGRKIARSRITPRRSMAKPGTVMAEDGGRLIVATIDYDVELTKATGFRDS